MKTLHANRCTRPSALYCSSGTRPSRMLLIWKMLNSSRRRLVSIYWIMAGEIGTDPG
jgi:hypothetical protein